MKPPPKPPAGKRRILVVDDHFVVRAGLAGSINLEPDLTVVAEASDAAEARALLETVDVDLVLTDLRLPGDDGVQLALDLKSSHPRVPVIVLSTYGGDEDVYRAFQAGAASYVLKTMPREILLEAGPRRGRGRTLHPGGSGASAWPSACPNPISRLGNARSSKES